MQLVAMMMLCSMTRARAMEGEQQMQEAVFQRMASMAKAASRVALAAEEAPKRSSTISSSSTHQAGQLRVFQQLPGF